MYFPWMVLASTLMTAIATSNSHEHQHDLLNNIETLPDTCSTLVPTEDCMKSWNVGLGAYIVWAADNSGYNRKYEPRDED